MQQNSIKKNYIYNVFYQILLVLTPVITTPYLSRILGADGIGEVSFVESVVSYFALFATLGINTYGQREISYVRDDLKSRSLVFYNTLLLKFITSLIVFLLYCLFYVFFFKSKIYFIFSLSIISVMIDITWFYQGLEEFGKIVFRNSILRLLSVILIFRFIKSKNDILYYCLIISSIPLLCNISLYPLLRKYICKVDIHTLRPFKDFMIVLSLFLPTIAIQIYTVLDKTMIGLITKDLSENGYYEQSMKISKFLLFIITSLGTVMIPRIGYYFKNNDDKNLKNLMYSSYRFVLLIGLPMCIGLMIVSDNFIPWFLGISFEKSKLLIKIFSTLLVFIGLSNVTGLQYMVPTNQQHKLTISVCIGAIINFTLNIFLIMKFKSVGAAIASIVAEFSITMIQFYLVKNEISFFKILRDSTKYIISSIIMFLVLISFSLKLKPSVMNTLIITTTGMITYFVSLIVLRDEFFLNYIIVFYNKFKMILRKN